MKIYRIEYFINAGVFSESPIFKSLLEEIETAIKAVTWHEDKRFVINPTLKENGVNPIKKQFVATLQHFGWETEHRMSIVDGMNPGPIDAIKVTDDGIFAIEWETGNVSSSHRALNKIALGIVQGKILGGILVLPIRNLSQYLTDRIGNYEEVAPYFSLYRAMQIEEGIMAVIAVDFDDVSNEAPLIPKGKDGNAPK